MPPRSMHFSAMRQDWIARRLVALKAEGKLKSKSGLATAMKVAPSRVTEIIGGKREVTAREVPGIAEYLEMPEFAVVSALTGSLVQTPLVAINVVGAVQAGLWQQADTWDQSDWRPAPIASDPRYASFEQFGLEVRGASMNEVYPEGSVIVCVRFFELGREGKPGERVVVHRRSAAGLEATVKELRQDDDGALWLWPRSSHPDFQQPWRVPMNGQMDAEDDVTIHALVIGSYRPEGA